MPKTKKCLSLESHEGKTVSKVPTWDDVEMLDDLFLGSNQEDLEDLGIQSFRSHCHLDKAPQEYIRRLREFDF